MSNRLYEETDYQEEGQQTENKAVYAKFRKNRLIKVNPLQIVVNLSRTQYDIIQEVVEQLGWVVQTSRNSESFDIMWTDTFINVRDLFKLNDHQKISHYPAIEVLARKNLLGKNLMKMKKIFPQDYQYFPSTWSLPSQYGDFMRYHQKLKTEGKKQIYIYKPSASCQGKGIKLFENSQQMYGKDGIIQTYINNPLLIENLKFDLRIYVLIYGCDPIRIYLYEQGLARFATQNYQKAKKKNLDDTYIHLTNYAINKLNKKFIFNKDQGNMDKGHKRSLSFIYKYLNKIGVDSQQLKKKIQQIIVKTILMSESMLSHMYRLSQPNLKNDLAFHILGFDVIIDQNYNPFLLEINHTPSFTTDTPLDKKIKKGLIKDTLKLINVNLQTKNQKINSKKQFMQKRSQKKSTKMSEQEKNQLKQQKQNERKIYQQKNLGGFKRLYPVDKSTPQYHHLEEIKQYSKQIFEDQNRLGKISASTNKISNQYESNTERNNRLANAKSSTISPQKKKVSKFEKLPAVSYKLRQKIPQLTNISSLKQHQIKGRKSISISAHFQNTTVKKVQFNTDDIFADVQKKNYLKIKVVKNQKPLNQQQTEKQYKNSFFPTKHIHLDLGQMVFGKGTDKQKSLQKKQQEKSLSIQKTDQIQLNENTLSLLRNRQFKQCHECMFIKKSEIG